jgi:hypothetical protein
LLYGHSLPIGKSVPDHKINMRKTKEKKGVGEYN